MTDTLKIGEIAKKTGASVGTLRYYESLKLIAPVRRGENGYRYYRTEVIQQVRFIKQAQALGFSLTEIHQILVVRDQGEYPCELVQSLLNTKIEELTTQIAQIITFKQELEDYRDRWSTISTLDYDDLICPLIETTVA